MSSWQGINDRKLIYIDMFKVKQDGLCFQTAQRASSDHPRICNYCTPFPHTTLLMTAREETLNVIHHTAKP